MARYGTCSLAFILLLAVVAPCLSASAQHTLGAGSSLAVEDHERPFLTSPDGTFSCGFREAGENAFSFSVWYTGAVEKTAVWTANPGAPVNGRGSRISFRRDGGLALDDANGTTVWESKTSGGGGALVVSLLDTGNLVILDPSNNNGSRSAWQSFDWPTDTLVPSQPLTKHMKLVAGDFSLYYDNDNVLRLLYDGPEISSIYWPNPDNDPFKNGRTTYNSSRIGVLDDNGLFLSSDNLGVNASDLGPGVKRRMTIEQDGNVRIYSMNPSTGGWTVTWAAMAQPCYVHGLCGKNAICEYQPSLRCSCAPGYEMVDPRDWRKGCRRMFAVTNCSLQASPSPSPSPEQRYKFVKMPHTDFYGYDLWFYQSVTFEYCKKICLEMCLCIGFSYKLEGQGLCYPKSVLFNGFTSSAFTGTIYLKIPVDFNTSAPKTRARSTTGTACDPNVPVIFQGSSATLGRPGSDAKWPYLFAFAGVLGVLDLIFIATGCWFLSRRPSIPSSLEAGYRMITGQFRRFTYRELKDATGNFKEELGRGGSGVVYRGVLDKGKIVAVKKLTKVTRGDEEFWAEMTVIGRINHINLVRIWGFCLQGKHKLLVYEYVENESLDRHLFATDRTLPWRERYRIALGTARGLAYLHHECLEWVIHCDVKPENILLTREFDAKIADFGLAKLSKRGGAAAGVSGTQLSHMRGTTGYMAPEWALNVPINAKVDVYSYGIVLLEIVIGSRISEQRTDGGELLEMSQIAEVLRQVVASGDIVPLVDGRLQGQFNPRQAVEMVRISLSCTEERSSRPTMDDIARALAACDDEDEHPAYKS
jgi:hypothetical protein